MSKAESDGGCEAGEPQWHDLGNVEVVLASTTSKRIGSIHICPNVDLAAVIVEGTVQLVVRVPATFLHFAHPLTCRYSEHSSGNAL